MRIFVECQHKDRIEVSELPLPYWFRITSPEREEFHLRWSLEDLQGVREILRQLELEARGSRS